jgi:hypothetical protein
MAVTLVRASAVISALAALGLAGAGCSTEKVVDKKDVQNTVSSNLEKNLGQKPDSVTCPSDLKGKVGATLDCQAKTAGVSFTVSLKVTSVDGDTVHYDVNYPHMERDKVAAQINSRFTDRLGKPLDSVTCPGGLLGVVGATLDCQAKAGGVTFTAPVKVTGVDGDTVNFDVNVITLDKDKVVDGIKSWAPGEGYNLQSVTCPGDLLGVVGYEMNCEATDASGHGTIHVTTRSVNGTDVGYDIEAA